MEEETRFKFILLFHLPVYIQARGTTVSWTLGLTGCTVTAQFIHIHLISIGYNADILSRLKTLVPLNKVALKVASIQMRYSVLFLSTRVL